MEINELGKTLVEWWTGGFVFFLLAYGGLRWWAR